MRVAVLTTDTIHHAYFVRGLADHNVVLRAFVQTRTLQPPFPVAHSMELARDQHESTIWFGGRPAMVGEFAETCRFETLNEFAAVGALAEFHPDALIVFGTGKLSSETISCCSGAMLNLHGGDPEQYRGLDTHLWAVYHGDFGALLTTLHHVAPEIDAGDIIDRRPIPVTHGMPLHELRQRNTELCLRITRDALDGYAARGCFDRRRQKSCGRYYSFMPAVLKEICVARFQRYSMSIA